MSAQAKTRRKTVADIIAAKGGDPLVCLTAYTTPMAEILDEHADLLLVGDSVGMVLQVNDVVKHTKFGVGMVTMIKEGKKAHVAFPDGGRILAYDRN